MITGLVLALCASIFTSTASITQRFAAAPAPGELAFSWRLFVYLAKKPIWFAGILCMILGFGFQVAALRVSSLSLVQPVIATELLFVFGFLAVRSPGRVRRRDWVAAFGMAAGLAVFLAIAYPTGGSHHAPHSLWEMAALGAAGTVALFCVLARVPRRPGVPASPPRQAALLAVAAGTAWGLVAAVIKELSGHLSGGAYGIFTNWSPYVLLGAGALAFFLPSNAFQAGPLAASQPGLTIVDPLVASFLGVFLFQENLRHSPRDVVGEALALLVLVASVVLLSRSQLVQGEAAERFETAPPPAPVPTRSGVGPQHREVVVDGEAPEATRSGDAGGNDTSAASGDHRRG